MNEKRKQVAIVTIKAYDNGQIEINGPPDLLMSLHIISMAERGLVEEMIKARQEEHEQTVIQKPGLRHIMELTKH